MSLAHSILQMKNKDNVFLLKEKSKEIYEKLSVLAFVEEYVNSTPNLEVTKADLLNKVTEAYRTKEAVAVEELTVNKEEVSEEKVVFNLIDDLEPTDLKEEVKEEVVFKPKNEVIVEEILEQPFDELEEIMASASDTATNFKDDVKDVGERKSVTLEEELQDTISVDVMADLFENAQPKSLNDKLAANIQIGLNDRIVFVLNLFNGKQEDYNRVVSQLNTFKSEKEAKDFINTMVKPDYNWSDHEELEVRFFEIIERKFA